MRVIQPWKLNEVPFVEGADAQQISFQLAKPAKEALLTVHGTVSITNQDNPPVPTFGAADDGSTLIPYLVQLAGKLTFNGQRKDATPGFKMNNLPVWLLWLESYIENDGVGPTVDDGGMQAASWVEGDYDIEINIPIRFYDPALPEEQQPFSYFRPVCYNAKPTFTLTGGTFFKATYAANKDGVALTNDTASASGLTYTLDLKISMSAYLVQDMAMGQFDRCADPSYEYIPNFDLAQANYNNLNLSDNEFQAFIHLINTDLVAKGTNYVEKGAATLGDANNGIIETDSGTQRICYDYRRNLVSKDLQEFMTSVSAWPAGLVTLDECGKSFSNWQKKTFLNPNQSQHLVNANGVPANTGSNFRVFHKTYNLSLSAKKSVGRKGFPPYVGAL